MTMADARRNHPQYFPQDNLVFVLIGKARRDPVPDKRSTRNSRHEALTQPGF